MTRLSVRRATPNDAPGIAVVHVTSWQRAYRGLLPQEFLDSLSVEARTRTWTQNLEQPLLPGAATFVAEHDGRVIGFASVGPSRDEDAEPGAGELWGLYLHPDHWGAGHGHALHAHAMDALTATGVTGATLWVLTTNKRARRFYELHGWVDDEQDKTAWVGDVRLEETRYRTSLR